jgi:hypothetical protein
MSELTEVQVVDEVKKIADDKMRAEIYRALVNRFLSDNGRIWSTAAVFIPVALGAFGIFANIKSPRWEHALLLGIASTSLLVFWNLIAQRHREFQDQSRRWIEAFEQVAGLPSGGSWQPPISQESRVRELREILPAAVALLWLIVAIATARGHFG